MLAPSYFNAEHTVHTVQVRNDVQRKSQLDQLRFAVDSLVVDCCLMFVVCCCLSLFDVVVHLFVCSVVGCVLLDCLSLLPLFIIVPDFVFCLVLLFIYFHL